MAWLRNKLGTATEAEALHFANALCRLGYIVPVNEKQYGVKLDSSCYRLQVRLQLGFVIRKLFHVEYPPSPLQ